MTGIEPGYSLPVNSTLGAAAEPAGHHCWDHMGMGNIGHYKKQDFR